MKHVFTLISMLCLLAVLSACSAPVQQPVSGTKDTASVQTSAEPLTREQAIELALQNAGLSREQVFDLEAELDRERGNLVWEVDFDTRDYEYSYDIHAETGAVTKVKRERD